MLRSVAFCVADAIALHVKTNPPPATSVSSQLHIEMHLVDCLVLMISR